jgi:hypothetical protein
VLAGRLLEENVKLIFEDSPDLSNTVVKGTVRLCRLNHCAHTQYIREFIGAH